MTENYTLPFIKSDILNSDIWNLNDLVNATNILSSGENK